MRKRVTKALSIMIVAWIFASPSVLLAESAELTKEQKDVADNVADEALENWDKYGVLPSVAVAQTFVESSLGKNRIRKNNLWGLRPSGRYSSYASLNDGISAYLRVLNNGRYDDALFKKDYKDQLHEILMGGYYGEDDGGTIGEYYRNCVKSILKYGFDQYDKKLFNAIKKKDDVKRKKKWLKTYTFVYDKKVPKYAVSVDKSIIKGGVVSIWNDFEMKGIYDIVPGQKGRKIGISKKEMDGMKVKIEVFENAKG